MEFYWLEVPRTEKKMLEKKMLEKKNENFLENLIGHANYERQLIFNRKLSLYYWVLCD